MRGDGGLRLKHLKPYSVVLCVYAMDLCLYGTAPSKHYITTAFRYVPYSPEPLALPPSPAADCSEGAGLRLPGFRVPRSGCREFVARSR